LKVEPKEPVKFGTKIAEIATVIRDKYIENENYWSSVKLLHPEELVYY